MQVFGDVAGVAQRDVRVVDQAPVRDEHDDRADQRPGEGPPQVHSATRAGSAVRSCWGGRAQVFGRGHRRGSYGATRYGCRMLDRFKVAAREKLQRAIAEVVVAEQAAQPR